MQNLEPGQIVQVNGKNATVISVGDGVVHLEQDGVAISVPPGDVTIADAPATEEQIEEQFDAAAGTELAALAAEIVALKQRATALEQQAARIDKVLAALTAGPAKSQTGESATAATGEAPAVTAPADEVRPGADNTALSAPE